MEKIIELIDTYLSNYSTYDNGKVIFECEYCELIFYKKSSKFLTLFGIYIHPDYREKGFCRQILYYLIDKGSNNFNFLCIQSVLSKILYEYLQRFKYKDKKFELKKLGFVYKL
jgi:hypothetical protein